jgi:hypothetical protein
MKAFTVGVVSCLFVANSSWSKDTQTAEGNITQKSIIIPTPTTPELSKIQIVRSGNILIISSITSENSTTHGRVGLDLTLAEGYQSARLIGLEFLAAIRAELGSLDKVKRTVAVLSMVNSAPGFTDQSKVMNGFSNLMIEVFGAEIGKHSRIVGEEYQKPFSPPVQIQLVIEVE